MACVDLAGHQAAEALFGLAIGANTAGQLVLYYGNSDTNTGPGKVAQPADTALPADR